MAESPLSSYTGQTELTRSLPGDIQQEAPSLPTKRRLEEPSIRDNDARDDKRRKGTAPVQEEYLIHLNGNDIAIKTQTDAADDDAAEAFHHKDRNSASKGSKR